MSMKRCAIGLLLSALTLAACAAPAQAGEFLDRLRAQRQQQREKYPPKWKLGTMSPYYIFRDKDGKMDARQVYPGYAEHFAPPAMFYYGYPHSGDDSGIGPLWW
ncbi:MAG: hypothetical protein DWQ37_12480 [Planctomycetota bacterium]|nr:MAG: hypothetical protein DWQ37_12480 [Planctomycetota bacterium]